MTQADAVRAAAVRLRAAGASLRERPASEVVDVLAGVLDEWCDPASVWRQRLVAELPTASGYSAECVRAGLELGFAEWSGDALRAVVKRELGARVAGGFPLTATLLAGCIPMPSLLQLLLPLVLRSPVLARGAARDPVTPRLVAQAIAARDAELGRCLEVVSFARDDTAATQAFLEAECVVASGSDQTVGALARGCAETTRFVGYGHRVSVAIVSASVAGEGGVADALARDIALWDQLGCLSPLAVYVEGAPARAAELARALAERLAELEKQWPRGEIDAHSAAAIARERAELRVRMAADSPVELHESPAGTHWTVALEADGLARPAPLHRFVRVHPVGGRQDLLAALAPLAPHLSCAAAAGFSDLAALARALAQLGASRICAPGAMQAPPLGWHHDGRPLLLPLARISDLEIP